jgi:hypothetical protein
MHLMEYQIFKGHQSPYYQLLTTLILMLIGSNFKYKVKFNTQKEILKKTTYINTNLKYGMLLSFRKPNKKVMWRTIFSKMSNKIKDTRL